MLLALGVSCTYGCQRLMADGSLLGSELSLPCLLPSWRLQPPAPTMPSSPGVPPTFPGAFPSPLSLVEDSISSSLSSPFLCLLPNFARAHPWVVF